MLIGEDAIEDKARKMRNDLQARAQPKLLKPKSFHDWWMVRITERFDDGILKAVAKPKNFKLSAVKRAASRDVPI